MGSKYSMKVLARNVVVACCIAVFLLAAAVNSQAQGSPTLIRYADNERWSMQDCMSRAKSAFESEGYKINWTGADAQRADKAPYSGIILCNTTPEGTMRVNVILASTSGNVEGENGRLWTRLRNPQTSGAGGGGMSGGNGGGGAGGSSGAGGGGSRRGCSPFQGTWSTTYSPITFRRNGNSVTGSYEYQGASSIRGNLTGNVLEGEFLQPNYSTPRWQRGRIRFVLSNDGQSFTGKFWDAAGNNESTWNGKCQNP